MKPLISTSPQIHAPQSTRIVMGWVLAALSPAFVWSVIMFGARAALVTTVAAAAAVGAEGLLNILFRRENTLGDLSAAVTGVLIGFNMPPGVPLFIPAAASVFAIAVVKWSFGGLGANWMNPALAGRVFVFFSWGTDMTRWTLPGADAVTGATVLGSLKAAAGAAPKDIMDRLSLRYIDLFTGRTGGSLGEVSAMLLLAGGLLLIVLKIADWEIPLTYFASFALMIWMFDGTAYGQGFFGGDVPFHLLSGGLMLGVLFMATDMATTPLTRNGRILFGAGCGLMTFVIRRFSNLPEGVSLAILFMNILVPLINRHTKISRYGGGTS